MLALTVALPAGAGEAGPGEGRITAMAQRLVFEHLDLPPERRFDFAFDIATLHPQPEPGYWAVVGGFAMNHGGSDYRRHVYVAAVRLVCKETAWW